MKRVERIAALTKILTDNPYKLYPFSHFCKAFAIAKSTLSEDILAIKSGLEAQNLGKIETMSGAAGGVRFLPIRPVESNKNFLLEMATRLTAPERILAGGMLYTTDLICNPSTVSRLGEIFMGRLQNTNPDCIMTVETSGIPLALATARAFNVPLVIARRNNQITEGSSVNINYMTGSSNTIQTMAMPKRALQPNTRVLIVDDVLKGGGTAHGMELLAKEVGAQVVGKAFLISTANPQKKLITDYTAFFTLNNVDLATNTIHLDLA